MKASELMIGDYVMTPLQKGTVIGNIEEIDTSFGAPDVCHITCDVGGCCAGFMLDDNRGVKPIPLTEEILQKCGFERKQEYGHVSYEINPYDGHVICVSFYESGIDAFIRFICGRCHLRSVQYFHEVQNLVRVITGKELTLLVKENEKI